MKITVWDIFNYIIKWKSGIAEIVLLSLLLTSFYIYKNQTYSAETIIRYTDYNAKSGNTPNGKTLDVYEITSPNVISAAIAELGIKASVEHIRSNIAITPIIPNEIIALKQNKAKEGEEYSYFPIDYSVKYTASSDKNGEYARDIIDAVVKNYSIYYSETYLNNAVIPKIDYDSDINIHDYLEVAEVIDEAAKNTITYLEERHQSDTSFRSSSTGMSLGDLAVEYKTIKYFDLPALFSNIFNAQITKDKDTLLKKYKYRKEQHLLTSVYQSKSSDVAFDLMLQFVESNKDVPNSYKRDSSDNDFDSRDVFITERMSRVKTTYDGLVDNYVVDGVGAGVSVIDADYCESVIQAFSKEPNGELDYSTSKAEAEETIKYIRNKMMFLYQDTAKTIEDYNKLKATMHIELLSGISIKNGISLKFYLLIAFIIGLMFGTFLAIVIEITVKLRKGSVQ